ncbi:RagB/SusD family nutrient uptake outer membrane protein [Mariniflexile ostreae]|uniref:RagB/SusD family nutrient uptake outer membrane protein n=1 Tax=Mariniflexile ostreae TaxID=1520892 RepID=A0ABV5FD13_9FLAO
MRKIIYILMPLMAIALFSCSDEFIDLNPPASITESDYFNKPEHFEASANSLYPGLLGWSSGADFMDYGTDLTSFITGPQQDYARGTINAPEEDAYWDDTYSKIRTANLLLERATNYGGNPDDIALYVATAKFFRAWHHYFLVQRFGGVPIVTRTLDLNYPEIYAPRNSRYEVVAQVLKDLEDAMPDLPLEQNIGTADKGKISKWAVMAFKAKVLLHEATWMKYVGTATDGDGVASGAGSVGYQPANIELYLQEAITLTRTVIDQGGFELWNYNNVLDNKSSFYLFNLEDSGSNPAGLDKSTNNEFILYGKYDFALRQGKSKLSHSVRGRLQPSRKMMDMFLCTDGKTIQNSPLFQGYVNVSDEYQNRDYRMEAYFADYNTYEAPVDGSVELKAITSTGYVNQKFSAYEYGSYREDNQESADYPYIRLAEVYLMYAEALYELNGTLTDTELDESINLVKSRAGLPGVSNASLIANNMDLLEEIRRERTIELYGENSRYNDLKRWGIAEQELNQDIYGAVIEGTAFENNASLYNPGLYPYGEVSTPTGAGNLRALLLDPASNRNFSIKHYLFPLPTGQIGLNNNLLQNPGY